MLLNELQKRHGFEYQIVTEFPNSSGIEGVSATMGTYVHSAYIKFYEIKVGINNALSGFQHFLTILLM